MQHSKRADDLEATVVVFPAPIDDTPSIALSSPDLRFGPSLAPRFRHIGAFNPTSPLVLEDPSNNSHDSDFRLFRGRAPRQWADAPSPIAPPVTPPNLHDLLLDYQNYAELHLPPPLPLVRFFNILQIRLTAFPSLKRHRIVSTRYFEKFCEIITSLLDRMGRIERDISAINRSMTERPPELLADEGRWVMEHERSLKELATFFSLDCCVSLQNLVGELEQIPVEDSKIVAELKSSHESFLRRVQLDPVVRAVDARHKIEARVSGVSARSAALSEFRSAFRELNTILPFQVRSLKRQVAVVKMGFPSPTVTGLNGLDIHSRIANREREKRFQTEVDRIGENLPHIVFDNDSLLIVTFADLRVPLRFQVGFTIRPSYPWCRTAPEVRVLVGDAMHITQCVERIYRGVGFSNQPIFLMCQLIAQQFSLRFAV
jgi:hypothetical protein